MVKVNATITITLNAILVIRVWVRAMKWAISGCCHYHYGEQSHVVLRLENEEHDSDYINQNERVVKHSRARLVVDTLAEVVDDTR